MIRLLFTGSFDPITLGHLEVINKAVKVCDELIVGVGINTEKQYMFSDNERIDLVRRAISQQKYHDKVIVAPIQGLVADAAVQFNVSAIVRGIRNHVDLDRELQIAQINEDLHYIDTILIPSDAYGYISSSAVKEMAKLGADKYKLGLFVLDFVADALMTKARHE